MKRILKFSLVFPLLLQSLISMGAEPYMLAPILPKEISQAQSIISFEMKKNTALRVGAIVTALSMTCGGLYYWLSPGPTIAMPKPETADLEKEKLHELLITIQKSLVKVDKTINEANENNFILREQGILAGHIFSFNYWKRLFPQTILTIFLSAIITGGLGPIGKYFKRFDEWVDAKVSTLFHDRTIGWFVHTRTTVFGLLDLVKKDVQASSITQLNISWELLRQDVIRTLGFIAYQKTHVNAKLEYVLKRFDQITENMMQSFEKVRCDILNQHAHGSLSESTSIDTLKDELETVLQECALIESLQS